MEQLQQNRKRRDFPSPFNFNDTKPITLVELRMRFYSGKIRSKPRWWEKVHDAAIVAKWRAEILENDKAAVERLWGGEERFQETYGRTEESEGEVKQWPREPITEAQLDYIIEQIKYEAGQWDENTGIFESSVHSVYESRSLIPPALAEEFVKTTSILEDVPEEEKDWHPGSNRQVLDLVHPSLYCVRIGETLVRKADSSSDDTLIEVLTDDAYIARRPDLKDLFGNYELSEEYQWLPTDFTVSDSGDAATPKSYINNLHPTRHRALYPPIASILARFVPLFEQVVASALAPRPLAVEVNPYRWYKHVSVPQPEYTPGCDSAEWNSRYDEWDRLHRWPHIPDPAPFQPPPPTEPYPLRGRTLQVIVKLANIVLTPENPTYPGGAWHVEGMANEAIVATGLYYYRAENITESRLAFRHAVSDGEEGLELSYEQSDGKGYRAAFGFGRGDALSQRLGHIVAEEGKCVAFPNVYQHHVDAFELADPTKPGVRKILAFFLVNPEIRILSTSDVPPQQEEWAMEEALRVPEMQKLPVELVDMIAGFTKDGLISRKEAEEHRARLMEERSRFVMSNNEEVFEMEFNMCEH